MSWDALENQAPGCRKPAWKGGEKEVEEGKGGEDKFLRQSWEKKTLVDLNNHSQPSHSFLLVKKEPGETL